MLFKVGDDLALIDAMRPGDGAADEASRFAALASGAVAAAGKGACFDLGAAFFEVPLVAPTCSADALGELPLEHGVGCVADDVAQTFALQPSEHLRLAVVTVGAKDERQSRIDTLRD